MPAHTDHPLTYETVENKAFDMDAEDARDYLLQLLRASLSQGRVWTHRREVGVPRGQPGEIFWTLHERMSEVIPKNDLLARFYPDADEPEHAEIVFNNVLKTLRKRLRGTGIRIEFIHGQGYRMMCEPNAVFPERTDNASHSVHRTRRFGQVGSRSRSD